MVGTTTTAVGSFTPLCAVGTGKTLALETTLSTEKKLPPGESRKLQYIPQEVRRNCRGKTTFHTYNTSEWTPSVETRHDRPYSLLFG